MALPPSGTPRLPTTDWSKVRHAGNPDDADHIPALERILLAFRPVLLAHLVHRRGIAPERAEDILHEFITNRLLGAHLLARADPERGRLRTLVLTALDHFLATFVKHERTLHNSPNRARSLERNELALYPAPERAAVHAFDLAWARQLFDMTLAAMKEECLATGRQRVWAVFETRLLDPILRQTPGLEYEELVERFGFVSPSQAQDALTVGKRLFRRLLWQVVGEYAGDEAHTAAEIRELKEILCGCATEWTQKSGIEEVEVRGPDAEGRDRTPER